jgi:uncharacterized repeat protein (TIGR01451 family)
MEFATRGAIAPPLSLRLVGAKPTATMTAAEPLPGRSNFVIGNDPKAWRLGVQQFQRLRYSGVYDGIDLTYYGNHDHLEHDFVVGPGANLADIVIEVDGADKVLITPGGDATLLIANVTVSLKRPVVYQDIAGERRAISGAYALRQGNRLSFVVGVYDHSRALVIDPVILFDAVLGGNSLTQANGVAVDPSGNIIVTGYTQATNYPVVNAAQGICSAGCGNSDAFLTKLDPTGATTLYSTYFGGYGIDQGLAVTTDQIGNAYITGTTTSSDFPTKNAFQSSSVDTTYGTAFVAKFDPNGVLVYSTFLGGSNYEDFSNNYDGAIAVDSSGSAYVVGSTGSTDFPLKNPYQSTLLGSVNAFLTKFSPSGSSLVFSTYLGGKSVDGAFGVAVDSTGAAYVTGTTSSTNFPTTTGALSTTCAACANFSSEAFVTKFKADGSGLAYSTFLGDSGGSGATGIAVDSNFDAYVSGNTTSKTFPVMGTLQQTCVSCADSQSSGFISKLNPAGNALVYSNYIGGHGQTYANAIAVDPAGLAFVAGSTDAPDYPSVQPAQAQGGLGIDSSTDSGTTIVKNNQGLASAQINAIVADASNPGTVYAATLNGVFKSLDSGVTWTAMNSGLPAGPNGKPVADIQSIAVQPSIGKVLVGVLSKGVYASVNGGTTWTASSTGFPSPFSGGVNAIAFDPSNPTTIYVGIGNAITLLKSVNSGANWTRSDTGLPVGDSFFASNGIIVDPRNSNNLYFSATEEFGSSRGLFASTDGAATWHAINTGLPTLTILSIAMDPASSTTLYAGTGTSFSPDGGVFKTVDSGAHWTMSLDAGSWSTSSLAIDPLTERVYAGLSGYGMVYSTDAGASWNTSNLVYANVSAIAIEQGATPTQLFGLSPLQGTIAASTSFLTNFSADGSSLVYSTYSGGPLYNQSYSVAVEPGDPVTGGSGILPSPLDDFGKILAESGGTGQGQVVGIGAPKVADISLTKTVDKASASVGETLTYTLYVKNNGPGNAHNPSVSDTLSPNSPFDLGTIITEAPIPNQYVVKSTPPQVYCYPGGDLLPGQSFTCSFTIKTNGPGTALNLATARSDSTDPNPNNNTQTTSTTIEAPDPATISPTTGTFGILADGTTLTLPFLITNVGPGGLFVNSASAVGSSNATFSAVNKCPSEVGVGSQCEVDVSVDCVTPGSFTGVATIGSTATGGASTVPLSGTCSSTPTGVTTTKKVDKTSANAGDTLTYTITVTNNGPAIAEYLTTLDQLDASYFDFSTLTFPYGDAARGGYIDKAGGTVSCYPEYDAIQLYVGSSFSCVFTVVAKGSGTVSNSATTQWEFQGGGGGTGSSLPVTTTISPSVSDMVAQAALNSYASGNVASLLITNQGPNAALNPVATLTLSSPFTFGPTLVSGCTGQGTPTLTCDLPTLHSEGFKELTADIALSSQTTGTLTGTVSSSTSDSNPANNTSTVIFTIPAIAPETIYVLGNNSVVQNVIGGSTFGTPVSPAIASSFAFDNQGDIFVAGPSSVTKYDGLDHLLTTITIPGTGPANPIVGLAVDGIGRLFIPKADGSVAEYTNGGLAVSPANGLNVQVNAPSGIALSNTGGVWIAGGGDNSLSLVLGSGAATGTPVAVGNFNGTNETQP